ncbi:HAMP domain-containing histidine kinase [Sphingobacteriaceae bacterium WQ 2009]|uniref:histidine kinase n=1 Tax=Rhinopithecimicrobium faecis TaxID=2820698 RepID=A0A8T4H932_9SPHI|nr:HAMP domain-containing histidine kinase [Sphingobacteriaceae bacterium WQ 2009]
MVKKVKLIFILMAFTALGTVMVVAFWLTGSYNNRRELFLSSAERTLFNVVQTVFQADIPLDSVGNYDRGRARHFLSKGDPKQLLPPFLLNEKDITAAEIKHIKRGLDSAFTVKGYPTAYQLDLVTLSREQLHSLRKKHLPKEAIWTRPMLVNPAKKQFLILKFESISTFILFNLSWHLFVAFLLVGMLITTFFFLLQTIIKQHKLAVLRKSFVNNMTHELKTPVATVMAAVEAIQMYVARDNRAKMEQYLAISKRELTHLHTLIERVLEVDVDEFSGVKIHKSSVHLQELLRHAIAPMEVHASKILTINLDVPESPIVLQADEDHLKNVISNLLDNAIKYADDKVLISIAVEEQPETVKIVFKDNGHGISKADQGYIFDLFFRVSEGNLHAVKGFGIGLSYVKQIVEKHGGRIDVESELKKGTTFTIYLPKGTNNL